MTPKRIQRKRSKGWRMPKNAIYVGRPTKWGNPFKVVIGRAQSDCVGAFYLWLKVDGCYAGMADKKQVILDDIEDLRGKDLACWCNLEKPCHADVLLKLANES